MFYYFFVSRIINWFSQRAQLQLYWKWVGWDWAYLPHKIAKMHCIFTVQDDLSGFSYTAIFKSSYAD